MVWMVHRLCLPRLVMRTIPTMQVDVQPTPTAFVVLSDVVTRLRRRRRRHQGLVVVTAVAVEVVIALVIEAVGVAVVVVAITTTTVPTTTAGGLLPPQLGVLAIHVMV